MGRDRGGEPAAVGEFVEETGVRLGEECRAAGARGHDRADADHVFGGLRQGGAGRAVQRQRGHSQGRFGLFGDPGRAAEDVGAELVPVRAAGRAAGEGEGAVERGAQVVQVVETEAFRERDALQEPGPAVGVVGGAAELERGGVRGEEGEPLPRDTSG